MFLFGICEIGLVGAFIGLCRLGLGLANSGVRRLFRHGSHD